MDNKELWNKAWEELTLTTDSYPIWKKKGFPSSSHWAKAKGFGDQITGNVVVPPKYGTGLHPRNISSPGSLVETTTFEQLKAAITSGLSGRIVRQTTPLDLGGETILINSVGSPLAPITIDLPAPIKNGRIVISRAAYVNLKTKDISNSTIDGIKLTDASHNIDIDMQGGTIRDTKGQGFLQTDPLCYDWQFWNARIINPGIPGTQDNQDHGMYIAAARGKCVIGNIIVTNPEAYGYQIYPNSQDLIMTGVEVHGSRVRGGFVLGTETQTTKNITIVGAIVTGSKTGAYNVWPPNYIVANGFVYDSIEWNNVSGSSSVMQYDHCVHADPALMAKGFVDAPRHELHATHDIDGKLFVTADAGAVAL
jgi:hypothetical protein